ncbi:MAG: NADH-quinone oxidoreductase subunit L [Planctomycetota bacterium]
MSNQLIWIPVLPLLGFLVNGLLGKRLGNRFVSVVGCAMPLAAFVLSWRAFQELLANPPGYALHQTVYEWITLVISQQRYDASFGLLFDALAAVMCLVITGVGSLIHLYSTGYMKGDPGFARFFAYLNLFMSCMLILVLGDNLLLLFVGWEGVGLCSYLLIGFWHNDVANCDAGRKAFLFNRVGDFGFLLGMLLIFSYLGTLDTLAIGERASELASRTVAAPGGTFMTVATLATLLLFVGATGKSAQIPLYPWLPDAMAGPTPVSALIHAATMVTSGVYLCCRLQPLFAASETTLAVIAAIGACTALLAALIALAQNDIKKVLAYSTVSQLGYMFFAIGVGAFGAALFHVVTHAFFKALLFLGSGSVIHALHHEQDMRKMGGLRRLLPYTHLIFLVGTAAIAGVPGFAGFFSKDEILFSGYFDAFGLGRLPIFWTVSLVTAGLTAFYMLRMVALTFWGESRVAADLRDHVHEPGGWMPVVLFVLAALSIGGGLLNSPEFLHLPVPTAALSTFTGLLGEHGQLSADEIHRMEWSSLFLSVGVSVAGLAAAWYLYGKGRAARERFVAGHGRSLTTIAREKFFVDEIYQWLIIAPFQWLAFLLYLLVDRLFIDYLLVNGSARLVSSTGEFFRRMQSGFISAYLLTFACGALVLLFILLSLRTGT